MSEDVAGSLYEDYEAAKLRVQLDERLTPEEKGREVTRLTDKLLEEERANGIHWWVIKRLEVEGAGDDGSAELNPEE